MTQAITNISVDVLKVHPRNTEFFDDISGEEYDRFKKSIQDDGLLSPLIVAPDMTVISGHQRLKACKELGYKAVPVIIKDDLEDEDEKLKKLIAANFGRLKNDPVKQGRLIKEYERLNQVTHGGARGHNVRLTREEIAKELGVDVKTVQRLKQLADLPQEFQDMISSGTINATTGFKVIARLSEEEQTALLEKLPAAQKFTQSQVQQYIDRIKGLEQEKKELQAETADAVKAAQGAAKANGDSAEYLKMKEDKDKAEEERRLYFEKFQTEQKKVEQVKNQYREMTDNIQKKLDASEKREDELQIELEQLREEALHKSSHESQIRIVDSDTPKEQLAKVYFADMQNSSGCFLAEMEGLALSKDLCDLLSSKERAALAENFRLIISRAEEILGHIWKTSKEAIA